MRLTPGSSVNSTLNWAKSTWACSPGGVSKRTSNPTAADGPDLAHAVAHNAVAAGKAALLHLTEQASPGQGGIGRQALAQIRLEGIDEARRRRALLVGRRLQALSDVGPDGLSIDAELPGDGADREALAMQIQDHDEFPKFDHRVLPPASGRSIGDSARRPAIPGMPGMAGSHENWGNFKCHKWGELRPPLTEGIGAEIEDACCRNAASNAAGSTP